MTVQNLKTAKSPDRLHYIVEWAERKNMTRADISRGTGADKGVVSKWFNGVLPRQAYLEQIASLFDIEVESLLRHPDDDWLTSLFQRLNEEEKQRAKELLTLAFPKNGNDK